MTQEQSEARFELQRQLAELETQERDLQRELERIDREKTIIRRKIAEVTPEDEQIILLQQVWDQRRKK